MAPFIPTPERPCVQTGIEEATDGHPEHAAWAARLDAANAARQGPPSPVKAHNRTQLALLERHLFGRIRTAALR